jgi:hypothetical protein
MPDPTKEEIQAQLDLMIALAKEREVSDKKYAMKLVERVVFGILALWAAALIAQYLQGTAQPKPPAPVQPEQIIQK